MPTRADFYIAEDESCEITWLGSIGMDGYPEGIQKDTKVDLGATMNANMWRKVVADIFGVHPERTLPDMGWPWPWPNSSVTDYAYVWKNDQVYASCFGTRWSQFYIWVDDLYSDERDDLKPHTQLFPDMTSIQKVRWDTGNAPLFVNKEGKVLNEELTELARREAELR